MNVSWMNCSFLKITEFSSLLFLIAFTTKSTNVIAESLMGWVYCIYQILNYSTIALPWSIAKVNFDPKNNSILMSRLFFSLYFLTYKQMFWKRLKILANVLVRQLKKTERKDVTFVQSGFLHPDLKLARVWRSTTILTPHVATLLF